MYRRSGPISLFKRLGTLAPRRTPVPLLLSQTPAQPHPLGTSLRRPKTPMFTSLTLRPSLLYSLLAILFPRLWTRKGDDTPPTLRATALRLLAFGKHPYPPLLLRDPAQATTPEFQQRHHRQKQHLRSLIRGLHGVFATTRLKIETERGCGCHNSHQLLEDTKQVRRRPATRNRRSKSNPIPLVCRFGNCELHPAAAGGIRLGKRSL